MLAERDILFTADLDAEAVAERAALDAEYERSQAALEKLSPQKDAAKVEDLVGRLQEIKVRRADLVARLREASPRLAGLQYPQPLDLTGVRAALDPGTAFLAYSVGEAETVLFVVEPPGAAPGLAGACAPHRPGGAS